jgi:hypothetical protein
LPFSTPIVKVDMILNNMGKPISFFCPSPQLPFIEIIKTVPALYSFTKNQCSFVNSEKPALIYQKLHWELGLFQNSW